MTALDEKIITASDENGNCNLKAGNWYRFVKIDADNKSYKDEDDEVKTNEDEIIERYLAPLKYDYELPKDFFTNERSIPLMLKEISYCYGDECLKYESYGINKKNEKIIYTISAENQKKMKENENKRKEKKNYKAIFSINGLLSNESLIETMFLLDAKFIEFTKGKIPNPLPLPDRQPPSISETHIKVIKNFLKYKLEKNETIRWGENLKIGNWYKFIRSECDPENLKAEEEFGFTGNQQGISTPKISTHVQSEEEQFGFTGGGDNVKIKPHTIPKLFEEEYSLTSIALKLVEKTYTNKESIRLKFCYPLPDLKEGCDDKDSIVCEVNPKSLFVETTDPDVDVNAASEPPSSFAERAAHDVNTDPLISGWHKGGLKRRSVKNRKPHNHNKKNTHKRKHTKTQKYIKKNKSKTHTKKHKSTRKHTKQYK